MIVAAGSDVGKVREINEDFFATAECAGGVLTVLCDGMGGHAAGEVASHLVAESVIKVLTAELRDTMSDDEIKELFDKSISEANDLVKEETALKPEVSGMGTTIVICFALNNVLYVAHAGDSRAYLLREGSVIRLTKDHSLVQEMVDRGELSEKEAEDFPFRNVITRCISGDGAGNADFAVYELEAGDTVLSCSDGLTNYLTEQEIGSIVYDGDFAGAPDRLIGNANSAGGGDNITVTLIRI